MSSQQPWLWAAMSNTGAKLLPGKGKCSSLHSCICSSLGIEALHRRLESELQQNAKAKSTEACLQPRLLALQLRQHNPFSPFPGHYLEDFSILWHSLQGFHSTSVHKDLPRIYLLS